MKPASFEYHAPTTVDEALALLQANGPDLSRCWPAVRPCFR